MKIEDSVAFVTGANRGLGKAFVRALFAAGARKVYAAARDVRSLEGTNAVPIELDVTKPGQIEAAARAARDVTILVNNAGVSLGRGLLAEDAIDAARIELETNVFGPLRMSRAFAPSLAANGGGAIVNVLSVLSWLSLPAVATYSMSKAAAWSVTNGLRNELKGTQVVGVHVAFMDTEMAARVPGPKAAPDDVARQTLRALEANELEVIVDGTSRAVKGSLSATHASYLGDRP